MTPARWIPGVVLESNAVEGLAASMLKGTEREVST